MGACCISIKAVSVQQNGRIAPIVKGGQIVNQFGQITDDQIEANDNDAAVDFALRRYKTEKKEHFTVKEILFSAARLPSELTGPPMTFLILSVNLYTLDEHDKKIIGKLTDEEIRDLNDEYNSSQEEEETDEETKAPSRFRLVSSYAKDVGVKKNEKKREFKRFGEDEKKIEW